MKRLTTVAAVAAAIAVPAAGLAAPASATPTPPAQADLSVRLEAPTTLKPGQSYTSHVWIKNKSRQVSAKNAQVHVVFPQGGVEDVSVEYQGASHKLDKSGVFELGDIGTHGFPRLLELRAKVTAKPEGMFVTGVAAGSMGGDANPDDNHDTALTQVKTPIVPPVIKKADLRSSAKAGKVRRGKAARFYGTVVNNGPNAANKVVVVARLSKNLKITRVTGVKYKLRKDGTIELNLAGLPKGKKVSFTVVAKAAKKAKKVSFSVRANSAVKDPNGANNYALIGAKVTK